MNYTALPLVTFKRTVHSHRADVVYHRVRLLLYASGIPIIGRVNTAPMQH
jgi:hypothetical protein